MTTRQAIELLKIAQHSLYGAIFAFDALGATISSKEVQKILKRCEELETLLGYEGIK